MIQSKEGFLYLSLIQLILLLFLFFFFPFGFVNREIEFQSVLYRGAYGVFQARKHFLAKGSNCFWKHELFSEFRRNLTHAFVILLLFPVLPCEVSYYQVYHI